jgi:hypothetical protein
MKLGPLGEEVVTGKKGLVASGKWLVVDGVKLEVRHSRDASSIRNPKSAFRNQKERRLASMCGEAEPPCLGGRETRGMCWFGE